MRGPGRGHVGTLVLSLLGTILGGVAGFWIGRAVLLRSARIDLSDYAQQLAAHADLLSHELRDISQPVSPVSFSFCFDDELASLKAKTFQSSDFKDIGRTRDGKLYCSAFVGLLSLPYEEGPPTLSLANGMHVYTNVAVILAAAAGYHATVLEWGDVDVVVSPDAFDRGDRPNISYMIAAVDRGSEKDGLRCRIDIRRRCQLGAVSSLRQYFRPRVSLALLGGKPHVCRHRGESSGHLEIIQAGANRLHGDGQYRRLRPRLCLRAASS